MLDEHGINLKINRQTANYKVEVVDSAFVLARWSEIDAILYRVFGDSQFNDKFGRSRPKEHTLENLKEPYQEGIKHILAFDSNDNVLGAFFVIPTQKPEGKDDCDLGWMFTIELHQQLRHEVANAIVDKVHQVTQRAGFSRIITEMGTKAGARFLAKKHGYVHTPTEEKLNRWTKELN